MANRVDKVHDLLKEMVDFFRDNFNSSADFLNASSARYFDGLLKTAEAALALPAEPPQREMDGDKLHEIMEHPSTDVIDYHGAADDIMAFLFGGVGPFALAAAQPSMISPNPNKPRTCYCPPNECKAPIIVGRQMPCLRAGTP